MTPSGALYWSAVVNGVLAAPFMAFTMLMATNRQVMGHFTLLPAMRAAGWLATAVMLIASLGLFAL